MDPASLPRVVVAPSVNGRKRTRSRRKSCECSLRTSSDNDSRSSTIIWTRDATRSEWCTGGWMSCSWRKNGRKHCRRSRTIESGWAGWRREWTHGENTKRKWGSANLTLTWMHCLEKQMQIREEGRARETLRLRWARSTNWIGDSLFVHNMFGVLVVLITGIASVLFFIYKKYYSNLKDDARTVWIIGASSGIGKGFNSRWVWQSATAIQYAVQGKNVILSSRSRSTLEQVQTDIIQRTGRDKLHYPILTVDIEKDESFNDIVTVFMNYQSLFVAGIGILRICWHCCD